MTAHYIEMCSCGRIISQCRCPATNKRIVTTYFPHNGCSFCKEKESQNNASEKEKQSNASE